MNSVFTTLLFNTELKMFDEHWQRLISHAQYFNFFIPQKSTVLQDLNSKLLNTTKPQRVRISLFEHNYLIEIQDYILPSLQIYEGVSIILSSMLTHDQLGKFKTNNYLPYYLAYMQAQKLGFFEGLLCNHQGYVVDGSKSGILLCKNNTLTVLQGGLDSIMRKKAINYAKSLNVDINYTYLKPKELAGEILLTNSLFGVVPVNKPQNELVKLIIEHCKT
jgi:4-amino-4-deoxychorismate lyase